MTTDILKNYYTEEEIMLFLGQKKSTLQKNRSLGRNHPPFIKLGVRILYPKKDFQEWVDSQHLRTEIRQAI